MCDTKIGDNNIVFFIFLNFCGQKNVEENFAKRDID